MLNVRLDKELESKLEKYSQQSHQTKSQVVKEALALYLAKVQVDKSPFDLGNDLFGLEGSGDFNASKNYKQTVKEKIREKHTH